MINIEKYIVVSATLTTIFIFCLFNSLNDNVSNS